MALFVSYVVDEVCYQEVLCGLHSSWHCYATGDACGLSVVIFVDCEILPDKTLQRICSML